MSVPEVIAIDGPAASGKSTIGKKLADELGFLFFDTGVMYRAVTWAALSAGADLNDEAEITRLAETVIIDILPPSRADGRNCDIILDGTDITWDIRRAEVDRNVSLVSAYPGVRLALTTQQRRIGLRGKVVMVGRDIGTAVMPEASLKIYLTASTEERARRRYLEQRQRGGQASFSEVLADIHERDQIDSTRAIAPLRPASDAVILDTDGMDVDQAFIKACALVCKTKN
ncbi:MAG: cytidylate kinase [Anaerolineae bacterium UTCFX2]|jgi:cytidylate kinase|nr:(d)CMP kinase [Anaerolineae bacterium]MCZ7551585.1 (d)CMP kinase [Anaerolineales bacterium]OQY91972.1 MAG: cytidylate kinase [Anaerolineae bacterium UTCFX2]